MVGGEDVGYSCVFGILIFCTLYCLDLDGLSSCVTCKLKIVEVEKGKN